MRVTRLKAARHLFVQNQKNGDISIDEVFDENNVDQSDILEGQRYYRGFMFVPVTRAPVHSIVTSAQLTNKNAFGLELPAPFPLADKA